MERRDNINSYPDFFDWSAVRNLPQDNRASCVVRTNFESLSVHLDVGRFSEYLSDKLDITGQLLDLVEIGNDCNWYKLIRVHLRHKIRVMSEVLSGEVVLQLVLQHLLQLVHRDPGLIGNGGLIPRPVIRVGRCCLRWRLLLLLVLLLLRLRGRLLVARLRRRHLPGRRQVHGGLLRPRQLARHARQRLAGQARQVLQTRRRHARLGHVVGGRGGGGGRAHSGLRHGLRVGGVLRDHVGGVPGRRAVAVAGPGAGGLVLAGPGPRGVAGPRQRVGLGRDGVLAGPGVDQGVHLGPGHLVVVVLRHHDLLHARVLELAGLRGGAELLAVVRGRHQLAAVAGLVVGVAQVVGVGRGGGRGGHGPVHCHAAGHSLTTHTYSRLVFRFHCPFSTLIKGKESAGHRHLQNFIVLQY